MGSLASSGKRLTAYTSRDLEEGYVFLEENSPPYEKLGLVSYWTLEKPKCQVKGHQVSYIPQLPIMSKIVSDP